MPYRILTTSFPEVFVLEPRVFEDDRGCFFESFNQSDFCRTIGEEVRFVQDNHSHSKKGALRGLHYQVKHAQGKLLRVGAGSVFDVVVDMRRSSPNFGKWLGVELSAQNKRQLWVPAGFAHGILVLSEHAESLYKTTDYYYPGHERCLL